MRSCEGSKVSKASNGRSSVRLSARPRRRRSSPSRFRLRSSRVRRQRSFACYFRHVVTPTNSECVTTERYMAAKLRSLRTRGEIEELAPPGGATRQQERRVAPRCANLLHATAKWGHHLCPPPTPSVARMIRVASASRPCGRSVSGQRRARLEVRHPNACYCLHPPRGFGTG
jgi:hypothetical protein